MEAVQKLHTRKRLFTMLRVVKWMDVTVNSFLAAGIIVEFVVVQFVQSIVSTI